MSAFLQVLNVRFAGRPSARPSRTGHPFDRGHVMPKEKPLWGGGQGPRDCGQSCRRRPRNAYAAPPIPGE